MLEPDEYVPILSYKCGKDVHAKFCYLDDSTSWSYEGKHYIAGCHHEAFATTDAGKELAEFEEVPHALLGEWHKDVIAEDVPATSGIVIVVNSVFEQEEGQ